MNLVKEELEVPKESNDVGKALEVIGESLGQALQDGWQTGQDIPTIVTAALLTLPPAVENAKEIGPEFTEDPVMATQAILVPLSRGLKKLLEHLRKDA